LRTCRIVSDKVGNIDAYEDDRALVCCCGSFSPSLLLLGQGRKESRKASSVLHIGRIVQYHRPSGTGGYLHVTGHRYGLPFVSFQQSVFRLGEGGGFAGWGRELSTRLPRGRLIVPQLPSFPASLNSLSCVNPLPLEFPVMLQDRHVVAGGVLEGNIMR
jgi:hypothetical protein